MRPECMATPSSSLHRMARCSPKWPQQVLQLSGGRSSVWPPTKNFPTNRERGRRIMHRPRSASAFACLPDGHALLWFKPHLVTGLCFVCLMEGIEVFDDLIRSELIG